MNKRIFALLLCLALCASLVPAAAAAEIELVPPPAADETNGASGQCGDKLTWELDDNGTLTISGSGAMWNFDIYGAPWNGYWNVDTAVICDGVLSIGQYAFCDCFIEQVTIPDSVKLIGDHAFDSAGALKSVTIPDSVLKIGEEAFSHCTSLEHVTVGSGVWDIGNMAFYHCEHLWEVVFRGGAPEFGSDTFYGDKLVAAYPASRWNDSSRRDYGGSISWVPYTALTERSELTEDYTARGAKTSCGFVQESGETVFYVNTWYSCLSALVAVKDGDAYTALPCTTDDKGFHRFSFAVNADTELLLLFKGDVNLDGELKASDGTMLKRALLETYTYANPALSKLVADVNGDGEIKASEGTMVARAVLGSYTIKW